MLTLNKPAYIGICILELSKALMYKYHACTKNEHGHKLSLLFTDTDSLMYEIKIEDIYENFNNDKKCLILVIIQLSQNSVIIQKN